VYNFAANAMAPNTTDIKYVACFTEDDGVYSCGHLHPSIREAMNCLVPDGGSFIRAHDAGTFRSLSNREFIDFLESLEQMPWSRRNKAQRGALAVPAAESAK
jgi:hypothetical protein